MKTTRTRSVLLLLYGHDDRCTELGATFAFNEREFRWHVIIIGRPLPRHIPRTPKMSSNDITAQRAAASCSKIETELEDSRRAPKLQSCLDEDVECQIMEGQSIQEAKIDIHNEDSFTTSKCSDGIDAAPPPPAGCINAPSDAHDQVTTSKKATTHENFIVGWDGDDDPLNPMNLSLARKWIIVLILSAGAFCV